MNDRARIFIIRTIALLFAYGAVVHWLIIFGVMHEDAPRLLTLYFHSLAVLDLLTAFGLWTFKRWAVRLGLIIAATQVASHCWMLWFHPFESWRFLDILFACFFSVFFTRGPVLRLFSAGK